MLLYRFFLCPVDTLFTMLHCLIDVNECMIAYVHGVLKCSGTSSMRYSVPGIGSGYTAILLKDNDRLMRRHTTDVHYGLEHPLSNAKPITNHMEDVLY